MTDTGGFKSPLLINSFHFMIPDPGAFAFVLRAASLAPWFERGLSWFPCGSFRMGSSERAILSIHYAAITSSVFVWFHLLVWIASTYFVLFRHHAAAHGSLVLCFNVVCLLHNRVLGITTPNDMGPDLQVMMAGFSHPGNHAGSSLDSGETPN